MGQLTSDFPQLPDKSDSQWYAVYLSVYAQLTAMGLPTPGPSAAQISHAQLLDFLQKTAGKIVKEELKKSANPDYSGKSDEEQTALVNDYRLEHGNAPPVHSNFLLLPFAPNVLTLADVTGSKQNGK